MEVEGYLARAEDMSRYAKECGRAVRRSIRDHNAFLRQACKVVLPAPYYIIALYSMPEPSSVS